MNVDDLNEVFEEYAEEKDLEEVQAKSTTAGGRPTKTCVQHCNKSAQKLVSGQEKWNGITDKEEHKRLHQCTRQK